MPALANGLGLSRTRFSGGPSFVGPLDSYTTNLAQAWSVGRRLLASYEGSLIRIRRSSDNAEQDIGYDVAGDLDTAAITAFVSSNSAYITTIYSQNGGQNLTQSTAAMQMRLVNAGTLDTNEGKPAAYNPAGADMYYTTAAATSLRTWIASGKLGSGNSYSGLVTGSSAVVMIGDNPSTSLYSGVSSPPGPSWAYYVDGVDKTATRSPFASTSTHAYSMTGAALNERVFLWTDRGNSGRCFQGYFHELICYSDVTAHRADVETALITYLGL